MNIEVYGGSRSQMLKKITFLTVFGLATTAMTAFATPACPDGSSMTTFLAANYSCQIGDKIFSNFFYTASGTNPVAASAVTVDTVGPAGTGATIPFADIGLQFNAPWDAAGPGMSSDASIRFTVTVLGGAGLIEDFGLAQTSGVNAPGSASVAERGCGPAPCNPVGGSLHVLTFDNGGPSSKTENETLFAPVGSVEVEKDISASVPMGDNNGFATISVVQDTFSQVPEPVSMGLMGGGLALLGLTRLRKRAKKA
jgi:hypothetical protein